MDPSIRQEILGRCGDLDIPLIGFASADAWDDPPFEPWVPEEFHPKAIYPETRTVVVIGMPVFLPILETSPSIAYHELYRTVNTLLDMNAYRIAYLLNRRGFPSIPITRDGYGSVAILKERPLAFFSHRHAAYLAGLGNFGVNNMLLTPEFGPRVRFASVFTAAEIPPGEVMNEQLCIRCMRCRDICPVDALGSGDYPEDLTDKGTCAARSEGLSRRFISPCGFCIKVCPVGEDRKLFHRTGMEIYDEGDTRYNRYHRAWEHVRSCGGG
jgi:epoxyqueuosine reductase QueG